MASKERGDVVIAKDEYDNNERYRPFIIVSDESYPVNGYLGIPMTTRNKENTFELTDYDIVKQFEQFEHSDNFVNPYSPVQVNDPKRTLCKVSDSFVDMMADFVGKAVGLS